MKKSILIYGTIAGTIVSAMLFHSFSQSPLDFKNGELLGYTTMIIAFATIFIAIKSHRDKNLDGVIGFGEAFKLGLGITILATIVYTISWMIISNTIAMDYMEQYTQYVLEQWKMDNLTQDEIDIKLAELDSFAELYKDPFVKIGMTIIEIFPIGFLISLISAFTLKRKPTT